MPMHSLSLPQFCWNWSPAQKSVQKRQTQFVLPVSQSPDWNCLTGQSVRSQATASTRNVRKAVLCILPCHSCAVEKFCSQQLESLPRLLLCFKSFIFHYASLYGTQWQDWSGRTGGTLGWILYLITWKVISCLVSSLLQLEKRPWWWQLPRHVSSLVSTICIPICLLTVLYN